MIERIYIPTYGRLNKQETYDNLPEKWQQRSLLVVAEEEAEGFKELGYPYIIAPCQGPGPEGANTLDYGLSPVRKWIAKHAGNIKFGVLDDDIGDIVYTARPSERHLHKFSNTQINNNRLEEGYEHHFEVMMDMLDKWLDEVVICALEVTWNPPRENDYSECWRQTVNHFYNGATFPTDKIDFTSLKCAQDYYILLQCLTMGYPNRVSFRYRIRPSVTQTKGGCEVYRTLDVHNNSMIQLRDAFPDFVNLKVKQTKTGDWAGLDKYGATIQWKRAFKSSQKHTKRASLESFF